MKPLVSVVVPVYNIADYIVKCLESLIEQDYDNLEIIVVDDGSTDKISAKICDDFAKKDSRVKVFHKKNGGLSSARNYGISKSKGEMIALVDGDDYVKETFVEDMVAAMKKSRADIVVCGYDNVRPKEATLSGNQAAARLLVGQENLDIVAWNKLYKREIFDGIEYPVGKKYEDSLTTYKLLAKAKKVAYIKRSLYYYVQREGSIMNSSKVIERLEARQKSAEEAKKYFGNNDELELAAEIAMLTAKYAFMDAAVKKEIDNIYYELNSDWIKKFKVQFKRNKFMTKKLKLYNFLNSIGLYKLFRTII